jgi:hypothetical protein
MQGEDDSYKYKIKDLLNEINILTMIKDSKIKSDYINRFEGVFSKVEENQLD